MKKDRNMLYGSLAFLAAFVVWTVLVCCVYVQTIGPEGSSVGFAAVNGAFHNLTGVHWTLYTITDWLGLVPIGTALGGFYLAVMAFYVPFEKAVVNYRPVLIEGVLEASYPSSTTMLALSIRFFRWE